MTKSLRRLGVFLVSFLFLGFLCYVFLRTWKLRNLDSSASVIEHSVDHIGVDGELRFLIVGDTGEGGPSQREVAHAMEERCQGAQSYHGLIMLGDNFYDHGVTSVDDPQWNEKFEVPYGSSCLSQLPVYAILGNHDHEGRIEAQIAYSRKNPRWQMPHRFYALNFGELATFTVFDSSYPDFCFSSRTCTVDFLFKQVKTTEASSWRIVLSHHPLVSSSLLGATHAGDGLMSFFLKPFACEEVDLWLSGHAHHLEMKRERGCRTDFIISGGGGADLQGIRQAQGNSLFVSSQHGFLDLTVSRNKLRYELIDKTGKILFSAQREKDGGKRLKRLSMNNSD